MRQMITFPPVVDKQICSNCKVSLGTDKLIPNLIKMTEDAGGIPAFIVRCPICKSIMEWETQCN
jgi:RNase P subunit RPR2